MPSKIEVDGVGVVEVDDSFFDATPDVQQATLKEIQASVAPPVPQGGPAAPTGAPRPSKGNYQSPTTFAQMETALNKLYPGNVKVNSRQRTPEHNRAVGGVEGSHHIDGHSIDIAPIPGVSIDQAADALRAQGFNITEKLHHKNHYHFSADQYAPPEGSEPEGPPKRSIEEVSSLLKSALRTGASKEELVALAQREGGFTLNPADLDEAIAYRDKGGKGAGFYPAAPTLDPDNPAGTAPPEGQSQSLWGELGDKAHQLYSGAIEGAMDAGSALVDAGGQLAFGVSPSAMAEFSPNKLSLAEDGLAEAPKTRADQYTRSIGRGIGGSLGVGGGPALAKFGAKAIVPLITGGVGSGIGGEVAEDIAPGNPHARLAGEVVGGAIGGGLPLAKKPIDALADKRFVGREAKNNPYAAFDAEISEDVAGLINKTAKSPNDPKGRAKVTVKEINSLETRYLVGTPTKIKALPIPQADKRKLFDAIEGRHSIAQEDLDALRGTVAGDHVANSITKVQRLRALTPEVRPGKNLITKGIRAGTEAIAPGIVGKLLRLTGGVGEAARVNSAEGLIKRGPVYKKLQAKVGPSGQRESQKALDDVYNETVTAREAERADLLARRPDTEAARAERHQKKAAKGFRTDAEYMRDTVHPIGNDPSPLDATVGNPARRRKALSAVDKLERQSKAQMDRFEAKMAKRDEKANLTAEERALKEENRKVITESHRKNEIPGGGFRGNIYQRTGLDVAQQDIGVQMLLYSKEIPVKVYKRFFSNPKSLKGGAGSVIVDKLKKLADEGKLKRRPDWTPETAPNGPHGNMVDAKGDPIRSLPAYQGGVAKNIARELVAKHLGIKPEDK